MTLSMHGKWGDPRQLARAANANAQASRSLEAPHGLMPRQIEDMQRRFETFLPKLAGRHGSRPTTAARFFDQMLPPGANLDPNAGAGLRAALDKAASLRRTGQVNIPGAGGSSGGSFSTPQTPYQPEFSSPDRQSYPVHRQLANIYWRMFYKLDPIVGTGIDMRSEMVWSNFTFTGEGVAGEIKDALDEMVEQTKLRAVLPFLTREFEVLGEVCPHLFYDDNQGIWTHIAIHNPDQLEVIWAPFLKMEPLIEFKPDDRLRQVVTSANPMLRAWRDSMPDEIKMALTSGRNIPLSPLNATFIPRRLHPYDVRGTSIMSRMWRLFMYEDSIYNASIAVARRAASPLKVAKLGDAASGWIPGPESEQHLLELLTMAETDPTAWLVYNYAVNFDLIGVQERSWKIEQSSEYIERMKLIALGISKAFLWGEVTYASAQSGLTVFLRRLKATREYFESMWLYPKFLRPVAVMNRWIKPTEAELAHNVRTKRSVHELHEGNRFIVPKFEWEQSLDPSIDTSMIAAMKQLKDLGVEFSKSTYASLVNRDFDTELQQRIDDALHERKVLAQHPELQTALGAQPGAGGGGGGGGDIGGMLPALPPEAVGLDTPPPEGGEALPPEGLPPEGGEPPAAAAGDNAPHGGTTLLWDEHGRFEGWTKDDAADLAEVMRGEHPSEAPWERMVETWREQAQQGQRSPLRTLAGGEPVEIWSEVKDYLLMEGYPPKQVRGLEAILRHERVLPAKDDPRSPELLDTVGELGDAEFWTGAAQR